MLGWLGSHISSLSTVTLYSIWLSVPASGLRSDSWISTPEDEQVTPGPRRNERIVAQIIMDFCSPTVHPSLQQPAKGLTRRRASPAPQTTEHS